MRDARWRRFSLGLFLLWTAPSWGWGSYGHEQIAATAVEVTAGEGGRWLAQSRNAIVRLSITPDCEWKANRGCALPDDPRLKKLVEEADAYEHPLHYFEPDAFVKDGAVTVDSASRLPAGAFKTVVVDYIRLLAANLDYVKKFPRSRPIGATPQAIDVAENGTAPWRVEQLAALAVKALKARQDALALHYLGALGHYVGDLSQPFHATMNYDGQVYEPSAKGIHSAFETAALETLARKAGATKDNTTKLWSHFRATEAGTRRAARAAASTFTSLVSVRDVTSMLVRLTGDSYAGVASLLAAYAKEKSPEKFLEARLGNTTTVREYAESRLGVAAAALAAVWRTVFREAGRVGQGTTTFDVRTVLENYPKPTYLPADVLEEWGNRGNARGTMATDPCEAL